MSIRVVPDTSGFEREVRRELAAIENTLELTVPVSFDVDTAELRTQLEAINARIEIPVEFDIDVAALRAQIEALDTARITIPVDFDVDADALRARLEALRESIRVRVDPDVAGIGPVDIAARLIIDRAHFRAQIAAISPVDIAANVDVDEARIAAAVRRAIRAGAASVGDLDIDPDRGGGLTRSNHLMASFVRGIGIAIALAPVLASAGAGIAAAWGGVSTAVAAIPGAIALLGIPIATVAIGIDKIKEQFAGLTPAIDAIRAKINDAFGVGFSMVAVNVFAVLSRLDDNFGDVAAAIAGVAVKISNMLATAENIARIEGIFTLVGDAIESLGGPLAGIIEDLLRVAGLKSVFDVFVEPIERFGAAMRTSLNGLLGDGTLYRAFDGLADVLGELTEGFVSLVNNGIRLFAAAAPGVVSFLDELTGFFNRFDYTRLGTAVGDVFRGIGEALERVEPGTIERITKAFESLGDKFRDPAIQKLFVNMIDSIPTAIAFIEGAIDVFARLASAILGTIDIISGFAVANKAAFDLATGAINFEQFEARFAQGTEMAGRGWEKITDAFVVGGARTAAAANAAATAAGQGVDRISSAVTGAAQRVATTVAGTVAAIVGEGFNRLGAVVVSSAQRIATNVTTAVGEIVAATRESVVQVDAALQPGEKDYAGPWGEKVTGIGAVIAGALAGAAVGARAGAEATAAGINPPPAAAQAPAAWGGTIAGVAQAVTAGGSAMALAAVTAANATVAAVTTGLGQVPAAAGQALAPTGAVVGGVLGQLGPIATTAMSQVVAAVTTGVEQTVASAQTLDRVGPVTTAAFSTLPGIASVAMQQIVNNVIAGVSGTVAEIRSLERVGPITQGAFSGLPGIASTAMGQVTSNVVAGVNNTVASVVPLVGRMRDAIPANGLHSVGTALMHGLQAGINAAAGAVIAAAESAVTRAIAAARAAAQIRSPSRVMATIGELMGEGLALGLDDSSSQIIASARTLVDGILTETGRLEGAFTGFDDFGGRLDGKIRAAIADLDIATSGGAGSGSRDLHFTFGDIIAQPGENASAATAQKLRTLSEMGAFG